MRTFAADAVFGTIRCLSLSFWITCHVSKRWKARSLGMAQGKSMGMVFKKYGDGFQKYRGWFSKI
jgi:hypothetical protein